MTLNERAELAWKEFVKEKVGLDTQLYRLVFLNGFIAGCRDASKFFDAAFSQAMEQL